MLTLGTKIKKLRELRNYTQEYMADKLGISQAAYSKMESDETDVSHDRLVQIAKALDISIQDILAFDERIFFSLTNNQDNASFGYIIHNNNQLSDNERKLYEDKIRLYEDKVRLLEEKCKYLEQENERLKAEGKRSKS